MASIDGIGGVFIDSNDAVQLAIWYETVLGIDMTTHPNNGGFYHVFSVRDAKTSVLRENPVFAINPAKETLPEKGRGFILNFRVDNLHEMLAELRTKDVTIENEIIEWERGKHGWIRDLDGNRIELYEEVMPE